MDTTLFVVDDSDVNLIIAETALESHYQTFTLPSAEAMFELLEDVVPDMILLDIMMPEMDGFEAIAKLRVDDRYKNIPVIFLTGADDAETKARCVAAGAVNCVTKPFDETTLLSTIRLHLQG